MPRTIAEKWFFWNAARGFILKAARGFNWMSFDWKAACWLPCVSFFLMMGLLLGTMAAMFGAHGPAMLEDIKALEKLWIDHDAAEGVVKAVFVLRTPNRTTRRR